MEQSNLNDFQKQIINVSNEYFDQNFKATLNSLKLPPTSKDYLTISIIGVQNGGKSTLLNHLFGTKFEVLKNDVKRTTQGIWSSRDKEEPLIVLDVEGNDSEVRALQDQLNFEKTVALYALAMSNMLIVNVATNNIGTYQGAQYGIVRMLMEMSLKMFKREAPKVILFCLRDFSEGQHDKQSLKKSVTEIVNKEWEKIEKPDSFKKAGREKFFKLEVFSLRKFREDKPEKFIEDVAALRKCLIDPKDPNYMFSHNETSYNLPLEDLAVLSKNAWEAITSNKDLNLPNEKIQLSSLKCNLIKTQIAASFNEQLKHEFPLHTNKNSYLELSSWIESKIESHMNQYHQKSEGYDKKVAQEKGNQLRKEIMIEVEDEIEKLAKSKRDHLITRFEKEIQQSKGSVQKTGAADFIQYLKLSVKEAIQNFDRFNDEIKYSFPQKREMASSFETSLQSIAHSQQKKREEEIKQDYQTKSRRAMESIVYDLIGNRLDAEFWENVQKQFNTMFEEEIKRYGDQYRWVLGQKLHQSQIQEKKELLYSEIKSQIRKKLELSIHSKLFEGFKTRYLKDQEGHIRNWLAIDDKEINEIYRSASVKTIDIYRELNKVPSFVGDGSQTTEELFQSDKFAQIQVDLNKSMVQQHDGVTRDKRQAEMSTVPWYLWLIFLFFTYDDLWFGEDYPFVYYPSMIILSIVALLLSMGHKAQLFSLFTFIMDRLKEKFSFLR